MSASGRLRVVGGELSGRRFAARVASTTRPTSDRVREAIASMVEARGGFEGTHVLDLFAGTGAMAIEALSRGAAGAVLVERDRMAAREIGESLAALGLEARATLTSQDLAAAPDTVARKLPGAAPFDRVFVDPPYRELALVPPLLSALGAAGRLAEGALVVVEHPSTEQPALDRALEVLASKRYGDSSVLVTRYAPGRGGERD
ncbi:MAG: 16S rRNA (guanine(966)-N(2))-methyltransferase RsmD [Sandaracinus sp.]